MKKVNLDKEIDHLYEKQFRGYPYEIFYTDGVIIKRKGMSKYITKCFEQSVVLKESIVRDLNYRYFLDEKNKICILFTETFILDENDSYEIAIKTNTIVVHIYGSEKEFQASILGKYYHFHLVVKGPDNYWYEKGHYYTDCKKYNDLPLVKAISRISRRPDKIRMNTINDIINS